MTSNKYKILEDCLYNSKFLTWYKTTKDLDSVIALLTNSKFKNNSSDLDNKTTKKIQPNKLENTFYTSFVCLEGVVTNIQYINYKSLHNLSITYRFNSKFNLTFKLSDIYKNKNNFKKVKLNEKLDFFFFFNDSFMSFNDFFNNIKSLKDFHKIFIVPVNSHFLNYLLYLTANDSRFIGIRREAIKYIFNLLSKKNISLYKFEKNYKNSEQQLVKKKSTNIFFDQNNFNQKKMFSQYIKLSYIRSVNNNTRYLTYNSIIINRFKTHLLTAFNSF